MSLIIETKERRDVAIADVVGAYLKANMLDYVLVKLTGKVVDVVCEVSKEYGNNCCNRKWEEGPISKTEESALWVHTISYTLV